MPFVKTVEHMYDNNEGGPTSSETTTVKVYKISLGQSESYDGEKQRKDV